MRKRGRLGGWGNSLAYMSPTMKPTLNRPGMGSSSSSHTSMSALVRKPPMMVMNVQVFFAA